MSTLFPIPPLPGFGGVLVFIICAGFAWWAFGRIRKWWRR